VQASYILQHFDLGTDTLNFSVILTLAIGDEIRDTSHITDLNDSFDNTRVRLRGNMNLPLNDHLLLLGLEIWGAGFLHSSTF
jgi:hypothetical protein